MSNKSNQAKFIKIASCHLCMIYLFSTSISTVNDTKKKSSMGKSFSSEQVDSIRGYVSESFLLFYPRMSKLKVMEQFSVEIKV